MGLALAWVTEQLATSLNTRGKGQQGSHTLKEPLHKALHIHSKRSLPCIETHSPAITR